MLEDTGKQVIQVDSAPAAIGPYSQAIKANGLIFVSGQIPLDPKTGEIVGPGDVAAQARQVLKNLDAIVNAAGSNLFRVVRTTMYLTDLANFATVNEIYAEYFPSEPPARVTIQISALPKGALVEIDAIATMPHEDSQRPAFGGV